MRIVACMAGEESADPTGWDVHGSPQQLKAEMEWLKTVLPSPANNNGLDFASAAADDAAKRAHDICNTVAFCHNDLLRYALSGTRTRG